MSRHTCDELGVCQNRTPRCTDCPDHKDTPPMVAALLVFAALLAMHFGGWLP